LRRAGGGRRAVRAGLRGPRPQRSRWAGASPRGRARHARQGQCIVSRRGSMKRVILGVLGAAVAALAVSSAAFACIAGPTLNVNPAQVKAGGEVSLSGFSYNGELPIVVRFNALDGPILGTFTPADGRFGDPEFLVGKMTIPANTK